MSEQENVNIPSSRESGALKNILNGLGVITSVAYSWAFIYGILYSTAFYNELGVNFFHFIEASDLFTLGFYTPGAWRFLLISIGVIGATLVILFYTLKHINDKPRLQDTNFFVFIFRWLGYYISQTIRWSVIFIVVSALGYCSYMKGKQNNLETMYLQAVFRGVPDQCPQKQLLKDTVVEATTSSTIVLSRPEINQDKKQLVFIPKSNLVIFEFHRDKVKFEKQMEEQMKAIKQECKMSDTKHVPVAQVAFSIESAGKVESFAEASSTQFDDAEELQQQVKLDNGNPDNCGVANVDSDSDSDNVKKWDEHLARIYEKLREQAKDAELQGMMLIGRTDKRLFRAGDKKDHYGSNDGLATARAQRVWCMLQKMDRVDREGKTVGLKDVSNALILNGGPLHLNTADLAKDRVVEVYALWRREQDVSESNQNNQKSIGQAN